MTKTYYTYILANASGSALYVGMTNDLVRRVWEHASGQGSEFTSKYHVDRLVYFETYENVWDAIQREKEIKGWRRSKKEQLIWTQNPRMVDLYPRIV